MKNKNILVQNKKVYLIKIIKIIILEILQKIIINKIINLSLDIPANTMKKLFKKKVKTGVKNKILDQNHLQITVKKNWIFFQIKMIIKLMKKEPINKYYNRGKSHLIKIHKVDTALLNKKKYKKKMKIIYSQSIYIQKKSL